MKFGSMNQVRELIFWSIFALFLMVGLLGTFLYSCKENAECLQRHCPAGSTPKMVSHICCTCITEPQ